MAKGIVLESGTGQYFEVLGSLLKKFGFFLLKRAKDSGIHIPIGTNNVFRNDFSAQALVHGLLLDIAMGF